MNIEKLARIFHNTYERLAPKFGYETREDTREFNPESPNGKLMMAVIKEVLTQHEQEIREEAEKEGYKKGYIDGVLSYRENNLTQKEEK